VPSRHRGSVESAAASRAASRSPVRSTSPETSRQLTRRGQRTRDKLIAAARSIFEKDGFLAARITDISDKAAVAHGTFYTYFDSKEAIFRAVAEQMMSEITPANVDIETKDPLKLISDANRQYWETFRANRGLFEALDQVSSFSPEGRSMRLDLRHGYERVAYERICLWQQKGLALRELDPYLTAMAMTALVGRFAQVLLGLEDSGLEDSGTAKPVPDDEALSLLDSLYARALGITSLDPRKSGQAQHS
jgi:AcrR family transcriptional regulator